MSLRLGSAQTHNLRTIKHGQTSATRLRRAQCGSRARPASPPSWTEPVLSEAEGKGARGMVEGVFYTLLSFPKKSTHQLARAFGYLFAVGVQPVDAGVF